MKHNFDGIIILFITMAIGVTVVGSVVLPQVFSPTTYGTQVINNGTDLAPVNSTGYQNATFTTTWVYAPSGCVLTVAFNHNYTPNWTTVATVGNTVIANFTAQTNNASNVTSILIPAANVNATYNAATGQVLQQWRYNTSSAETGVNVTDANLTCVTKNAQQRQGWDAGTAALWTLVGLTVVAGLIMMVAGRR